MVLSNDIPTVHLLNHFGRHFEWLAPSALWTDRVGQGIREWGKDAVAPDPTTEEALAMLIERNEDRTETNSDELPEHSDEEESTPSIYSQPCNAHVDGSFADVMGGRHCVSEYETASCAGSCLSGRQSQRSYGFRRGSVLRDALLLHVFAASGVLTNSASTASFSVWKLVESQLQQRGMPTFESKQSLGNCLSKLLARAGAGRLAVSRREDGTIRSTFWNIDLERLSVAFNRASSEGSCLRCLRQPCILN